VFRSDVRVSGYWFHYALALVKRLRKVYLADAYKNEQEMHDIFRCLLSLPLLPVDDIVPVFEDVKSLLNEQTPSKDKLQQILQYVERQWLRKSTISHMHDCLFETTRRELTTSWRAFMLAFDVASK